MKKLLLILILICTFVSCQNEGIGESIRFVKNTEVVYVDHSQTKSDIVRLTSPLKCVDPTEECYFYLRIDNTIPGIDASLYPADLYIPRDKKMHVWTSTKSPDNRGELKSNADWSSNEQLSKYIFCTDGKATNNVIVSQPDLKSIVECGSDNKNSNMIKQITDNIDDLHVIWYVVKKQSDGWHVDGIVTTKDKTDIGDTSYGDIIKDEYPEDEFEDKTEPKGNGSIEVDIHGQEHKDWNEIKTSLHLRDTVDVKIIIPIPYDYQAELDDFAIRVDKQYEYIVKTIKVGAEYFNVEFEILHESDRIEIFVKGSDCKEALRLARECYDDGLTFEVHSYVKPEVTEEQIWEWVKASKITTTPTTKITGQLSSAYYMDEVVKL